MLRQRDGPGPGPQGHPGCLLAPLPEDPGPDDFGDEGGSGYNDGNDDYDDSFVDYGADGMDDTGPVAASSGDVSKEIHVVEEGRFLRSKFGNALLIDSRDFQYQVNRKMESRIYWKCTKVKKFRCKAKAVTEGFFIISKNGAHNHNAVGEPLMSPQDVKLC